MFYYELDGIIRSELDKNQRIAIYPFGRIGLQARDILVNRYGRDAIIIDNNLSKYNRNIFSIESFKKMDSSDITIIVCTSDKSVNQEIWKDLENRKLMSNIRNIFDIRGYVLQTQGKEEYFKELKRLCKVNRPIDYELIRIGPKRDGGYIMLNDFRDSSIAYSFGIGRNIIWDEAMADYDLDVYCYDHTIDQLPRENVRLHFQKIGISGEDKVEENLLSMETIIKSNGHQNANRMILKMDVEGAEWEFIQTVSEDILKLFSQITFELHGITDFSVRERTIGCLEKLRKTHYPIWIHGNNNGGAEKSGAIVMPRLLEITYVNREYYSFMEMEYNCPLEIDEPNMAQYPDIELRGW